MKRITFIFLALLTVAQAQWQAVLSGSTPSSAANMTVDFWQDYEFNATVDATALAAHDHVVDGTWSVTDSLTQLSTNTSAQKATISTINGSSSAGTYGLKLSGVNVAASYIRYDPASAKTSMSMGFWFYATSSAIDYRVEFIYIDPLGQEVFFDRSSGVYRFYWTAGTATAITFSPDTWYWVTIKYVKNGTGQLRLYDTSGVQVGSETTTSISNSNMGQFYFGQLSATAISGTVYTDNWVIDWTTATYPLGP